MATDLYSAGVQAFFVAGRRFDLCEVFVGEHESNTFKVWCECSNLLWDTDPKDGYREVLTMDGWKVAKWDDHFKAWMPDWDSTVENPIAES